MLEKRGQVTVFIILGLIILIFAGLIYYLTAERIEVELPEKFIRETPEAILPIRYYVDDCIELVAREAVQEIGLHGGWLQEPDVAAKTFDVSYDATESNAVRFSESVVPYWYYMRSRNDCTSCQFSQENMATLATMSNEINRYVNSRLQRCLGDFSAFEEEGFSVKKTSDVAADTRITDETVLVTVQLMLEIEKEDVTYTMENYAVQLPVKLKKIYELGLKILETEADAGFLEKNLLNLISYSSNVDSDALPPFFAHEIDFGKVIWSKTAVRQKIQDLLATYTPLITIPGTHNFRIFRVDENSPGYRVRQGLFTGFVFNIVQNETGFESIDASFNYFNWPLYFDIKPSDGELVGPKEIDANFQNLLFIPSKTYDFRYYVSFPVVIELRDVDAFNREGYSFLFALESNIRNNDILTGEVRVYDMLGAPGVNLFREENQRISGEVSVNAFEAVTGESLEGAEVRFTCGPDSITIGMTDENGRFSGRFPICTGGVVRVHKEGYLGDGEYIDTEIGKKISVDAFLTPIITKTARLKIRWPEVREQLAGTVHGQVTPGQLSRILETGTKNRTENETVFMTIRKVADDESLSLSNMLIFEGDTDEQEIRLVPGMYEINAQYMWLPGIYIPEKTETYDVCYDPLKLICESQDVTLPEINITPSPLGGAVLNNATGYWIVTEDNLQQDTATFYVLRETEPTDLTGLDVISKNEESSKAWRSLLEPKWD
jgi:hypothetical protein